MASDPAIIRKSSQEVEIDHLLAEEFSCDPAFARRFAEACGLACEGLRVTAVAAEPSLDGEGFGDLLVECSAGERRIALLIEDKITAGPAARQAARYATHAQRLRERGWDEVWTILVAPTSYGGESRDYDHTVSLETVAELLDSPDPLRLSYRRDVIARALRKKASSGVKVADPAMHALRAAYLDHVRASRSQSHLTFPNLRNAYYDGDCWVEPIRAAPLPAHAWVRHRSWTSNKAMRGSVDLIVSPASDAERRWIEANAPTGAAVAPFSGDKGVQVSVAVAELRQTSGFAAEVADRALAAMDRLVDWYGAAPTA